MLAAILGALLLAAPLVLGLPAQTISLDGRWKVAQDTFRDGEAPGWVRADYDDREWDYGSVPQSWMTDPRFQYTGTMFYRRRFTAPELGGKAARLRFEAVFARARVWLNGRLLGTHEGPYTPFEFDVTAALKPGAENLLVVAADNSWTTKTLPGGRPGTRAAAKVYPFNFHIDDHFEWYQDGRYYAIVKDHDAPYLTEHGRCLYLLESEDGLKWRTARHALVKDFSITWEDGRTEQYERLEMPKLYLEGGRPRVLFLAALERGAKQSYLVALPLRTRKESEGR